MTNAEKAQKMREWFQDRELPAAPIPYVAGETITDPEKFVATQLQALDLAHERTRMHRNSYMRLYQLKLYIESCPKNA